VLDEQRNSTRSIVDQRDELVIRPAESLGDQLTDVRQE
jgi:hypothetical protein